MFSLSGKLKNIGFWIFLFLIIVYIPLFIIYFSKGTKSIIDYLFNEMAKNGYLNLDKNNKNIKKRASINFINNKNIKKRISINFKNNKNLQKRASIIYDKNKKLKKRDTINYLNNFDNKTQNLKKRKSIKHSPPKKRKSIQICDNNKEIKIKKRKSKRFSIKNKIYEDISSEKNIKFSDKKDIEIINQINIEKKDKKNNFGILPTQGIDKNKEEINEKVGSTINFNLININLNNIKEITPKNSLQILNNYTFNEAIKYDMRSICAIFYIFILSKEPICHTFLYKSQIEIFPLRLCVLIFIISNDLALNALFYLDDKISQKYKYAKNLFLFSFSSNITIILLSTLIGFIFMTLFTNLSNTTNSIRDIFRKEEENLRAKKKYVVSEQRKKEILNEIVNILKKHKIKVISLIIIEILLMIFFWYYTTAFCHVYSNTQISWLLDSLLSMLSRLVVILIFSLGFAKLYRLAIQSNTHCIYKFVLFFYSFG